MSKDNPARRSLKGMAKEELARVNKLVESLHAFFGKIGPEEASALVEEYRDHDKIGPRADYSHFSLVDCMEALKGPKAKKLASGIAPFLYSIEVRHKSFSAKIMELIFSPKNKRRKQEGISAVNNVLGPLEPFRIDNSEIYDSVKATALSNSEVAAITGIEYYLHEFIRVRDAGKTLDRQLKDFELDSLTCAILHEFSTIKSLRNLHSGLIEKRLSVRRKGSAKARASLLRKFFEEQYVKPSEEGESHVASIFQRLLDGDDKLMYQIVREKISSLLKGVPVVSFFKQFFKR